MSEEIEKRFTYHAPKGNQTVRYTNIREKAKALALMIEDLAPPSKERDKAITYVESAVMWANAAIARNE